jgi:hypothetical protein
LRINLGKPVRIHVNGIEGAGTLTICQPETAPGTPFATARYNRGCATTLEAAILGYLVRLQMTAVAPQSCDQLFGSASVDFEVLRNLLEILVVTDCALSRINLASDQFFGKRETTRLATRTAVGAWQQVVGCFDARIFVDFQEALRNRQNRAKK